MKSIRKIIAIDEESCNGCGQCVSACAEGAIEIRDSKARLISDIFCDGLGACIGECPQGALRILEEEAEAFDPEAVERHLEAQRSIKAIKENMPCGCPSQHVQMLKKSGSVIFGGIHESGVSGISHWPVQIRLVPPNAPFLKGADLLVAADCTPVAYPYFHRDFVNGNVVLIGCPKLDDKEEYVRKFADIFRSNRVDRITVLKMEVPCCSALAGIVKKAMELAGQVIPVGEITISIRGERLKQQKEI